MANTQGKKGGGGWLILLIIAVVVVVVLNNNYKKNTYVNSSSYSTPGSQSYSSSGYDRASERTQSAPSSSSSRSSTITLSDIDINTEAARKAIREAGTSDETDASSGENTSRTFGENNGSRGASRQTYGAAPAATPYYYSSPPGTYSSPSYGDSTMGGYASSVETRIEQQRSADRLQRENEERRLESSREP